eukprot:scaffold74320_cov18-Phaeocystis_antarctica.AAC.1
MHGARSSGHVACVRRGRGACAPGWLGLSAAGWLVRPEPAGSRPGRQRSPQAAACSCRSG